MADRRRTAKSVSKRRYGEARQKFRTKGRIPFHGVEKVCFPPSSPRTTIAKIGPEFSSVAPRGEYELREFEVTANGRSLSYPPCPSRSFSLSRIIGPNCETLPAPRVRIMSPSCATAVAASTASAGELTEGAFFAFLSRTGGARGSPP